ncbi:hypothetical protein [Pseudogemmobacter sonorensis]|uniref:hypothetical protein n=1 Tax=Pseudogemmobacter sonorensis TaxID=2989681 RepID=UPI00368832B6
MRLSLPAPAATALALALALGLGQPARADLVIDGRAAQALHCSALLYMVADELYHAGYLGRSDYNAAQQAAVRMLAYVPGTNDQKAQAMRQRFEKLMRSRSLPQLFDEFDKTAPWCRKTFL